MHRNSAAICRLILAAAMLAGLVGRWAAWPVRAEPAGDAPPRQPRDGAG
ncbi:MAG: hypothetical protein GYA20_04750 [Chloroflexi bacterium]|nr:hypothetical protein [Chloroflexota bacterium]